MKPKRMPAQTRPAALAAQFLAIRNQTETICRPLLPEDAVMQPITDVSPPKWHLAHTTWFFETFVLKPFKLNYAAFHPQYNFLFNSYYNSIGSRVLRNQRGTLSRPPLIEIYEYRAYVNMQVNELLQQISETELNKLLPVFELGLQHEQQHQELLLTDIKYILSTNPLLPAYLPKPPETVPDSPKNPSFLKIPGGLYEIGYKGNGFCFDNEKGVHQVYIGAFEMQDRLVTNGEFLEFMNVGGYENFENWLGEGFELAQKENWEAPLYWFKKDETWHHFTLHGPEKINLNAPVCHVSFYEAHAYATWAGCRLPTEFEWEAATGLFSPDMAAGNFSEKNNYRVLPARSGETCQQLFGDAWEWTYSAYHPYPGYKKDDGALGEYNGKFMINQMVLRGGSCATPQSRFRPTYRNFFHADKRWQFTGIRLVK